MENARQLVDTRTRIRSLVHWSDKLPLNVGFFRGFVRQWCDFHFLSGRCGAGLKVVYDAIFWVLKQIKALVLCILGCHMSAP